MGAVWSRTAIPYLTWPTPPTFNTPRTMSKRKSFQLDDVTTEDITSLLLGVDDGGPILSGGIKRTRRIVSQPQVVEQVAPPDMEVVVQAQPTDQEESETMDKRRRIIDTAEAAVEETRGLAMAGAPTDVVTTAIQRIQATLDSLPSSRVRRADPRVDRLNAAINLLRNQYITGLDVTDENFQMDFAQWMMYSKENTSQRYAELAMDLALDAILKNNNEDNEFKLYAQNQLVKLTSKNLVRLGVITREFTNMNEFTRRLLATMLNKQPDSATTLSPYTRAYNRYFNLSDEDNQNLMQYVVQQKQSKIDHSHFYKVRPVTILTGDRKIATVDTNAQPDIIPRCYYACTLTGVDPSYIEAIKRSNYTLRDSGSLASYLLESQEVASKHFFGRGDITSLALRLVKCFKVYTLSQQWKREHSLVFRDTWVFKDAINALSEASKRAELGDGNGLYKGLKFTPTGVWQDMKGVGASAYQRALWYFSSYLRYGSTCNDQGISTVTLHNCGLNGMIGLGSEHVQPSTWMYAFYKKVYADDLPAGSDLTKFMADDDGRLMRYVSTGVVNAINITSEAGLPYPKEVKKLDVLNDALRMADKIFYYVNTYLPTTDQLRARFPEIFLVVIKPKAEVFALASPIPVVTERPNEAQLHMFAQQNAYLPKGRGIFVPCPWTTIPMGFITSFVSHRYVSQFKSIYDRVRGTGKIYDVELNQEFIAMKDMTFAYGLFDFFFRRVQVQFPFDTQYNMETKGYMFATYSDNFYAAGETFDSFETELDTIYLAWNGSTYDRLPPGTLVPQGSRVYISADGEKAETGSDEIDVLSYLRAFCDFFVIPPDVAAFIIDAARFTVNGGNGVFGDKQIHMGWQGSGNQLTFALNDFKMAQVCWHYTQLTTAGQAKKISWPTLKQVGRIYGASITLERVIILPPINTPLLIDDSELDVDLLGLSARLAYCNSVVGLTQTLVPVLSKERRNKAMLYSKSMDENRSHGSAETRNARAQAMAAAGKLNFGVKALALLLSGAVNVSHEKDVLYTAILLCGESLYATLFEQSVHQLVSLVGSDAIDVYSLMDTFKDDKFEAVMKQITSPAISDETKLVTMDGYFITKYLQLVQTPVLGSTRPTYINSNTHLARKGYSSNNVNWAPVFAPNKEAPVVVQSTLTDSKKAFPSLGVFNALILDAVSDPTPWPSMFEMAANGGIDKVIFATEDPLFIEKLARIMAARPAQEGTPVKEYREMIYETLKWYLTDHPYRSSGYQQSLVETKRLEQIQIRRIEGEVQKRMDKVGAPTDTQADVATAVYGPEPSYGRKTWVYAVNDERRGPPLVSSGQVQIGGSTEGSKYFPVFTLALNPMISLNPYLRNLQDSQNIMRNWRYDNGVRYKFISQERSNMMAQHYIVALRSSLILLLRTTEVREIISKLTASQINQISVRASLYSVYPPMAYVDELSGGNIPRASFKNYLKNPVSVERYHFQPKQPTYNDDIDLGLKQGEEYLVNDSFIFYNVTMMRNEILNSVETGIFNQPESAFTRALTKAMEEFGRATVYKCLIILLSVVPTQEPRIAVVDTLGKPIYNSGNADTSTYLKQILEPSLASGLLDLRDHGAAIRTLKESVGVSGSIIAEVNSILVVNEEFFNSLGQLLWRLTEKSLGDSRITIVTLKRHKHKNSVDLGFRNSRSDYKTVGTVWDAFYSYVGRQFLSEGGVPRK